MDPVRVLIVDDHELFRQGVAGVLAQGTGLEVVGQAADGAEALEQARQHMPDVILMDIHMPGCNGLETTRRIKAELPYVRIIMLTVSDHDEALFGAIKAGASGYLLKNVSAEQLTDAIVEVARGGAAITGTLAYRILEELSGARASGPDAGEGEAGPPGGPGVPAGTIGGRGGERGARRGGAGDRPPPDLERLTPREVEVLRLVSRGLTNREIAEQLYVSVFTVKNHLRNVLEKLHLRNRAEAAAFAVSEGLTGRNAG